MPVKLPPRLYYTLGQAAAELGADPEHLLHLAAVGEFQIFAVLKGHYSVIPLIDEAVDATRQDFDNCTASDLIEAMGSALGLHCQAALLGLWSWNAAEIEHFGETKAESFSGAISLPSHAVENIGKKLEQSFLAANIPYQCDAFIVTPDPMDGVRIATGMIGAMGRERAGEVIAQIYSLKRMALKVRRENLYLDHSEVARLKGPEPSASETSPRPAAPLGLARINQRKAAAKEKARQAAAAKWSGDTDKQYRVSDMADMVYRQLALEGMIDALPDRPEGVIPWIKPVAPEYASKPGRRKKSP